MRQHGFRLSPEREQKLKEIFTRYGVIGESETDKWRDLIDKIYEKPNIYKNSLNSDPAPVTDPDYNRYLKDITTPTKSRTRMREKVEEIYQKEQARQRAKTEGERERAKIREEERLLKRTVRSGKPKVDWGNSAGVDPFCVRE